MFQRRNAYIKNVLAIDFDSYCFTGQTVRWIDTSSVWTITPGLNFSVPIGNKEIDTVVDEYAQPKTGMFENDFPAVSRVVKQLWSSQYIANICKIVWSYSKLIIHRS